MGTFLDSLPEHVRPTFPNLAGRRPAVDELSDTLINRYRKDISPRIESATFGDRFARSATFLLPYLSAAFGRKDLRALEVGCGAGAKAMALAPIFSEYVGVDIVRSEIESATRTASIFGHRNTRFENIEAANLEGFLDEEKKFDVILLYAVLEHLTIEEKLNLLALCWNRLADDGFLFVGEAPNRAVPTDFHSSKLLYFQGMPIDLWERYYERSPNKQWRQIMRAAKASGKFQHTAYRRGVHVGHQEFELGLPSSVQLAEHVLADNFAVEQLNLYPYTAAEFAVLLEQEQLKSFPKGSALVPVDLHPAFSRYYIEMVLKKEKVRDGGSPITVMVPGERGALWNRRLSDGLRLAGDTAFRIPARAAPRRADRISVNISIRDPMDAGVVGVVTQAGDTVAELNVPELTRSIGTHRANLAVSLPTLEAANFPLTLRPLSGTSTVSYIFLRS